MDSAFSLTYVKEFLVNAISVFSHPKFIHGDCHNNDVRSGPLAVHVIVGSLQFVALLCGVDAHAFRIRTGGFIGAVNVPYNLCDGNVVQWCPLEGCHSREEQRGTSLVGSCKNARLRSSAVPPCLCGLYGQ